MKTPESPQNEKWPIKAYKNPDFLSSQSAREIRVLCELIEPEQRFAEEGVEGTVVLFGSARTRTPAQAESDPYQCDPPPTQQQGASTTAACWAAAFPNMSQGSQGEAEGTPSSIASEGVGFVLRQAYWDQQREQASAAAAPRSTLAAPM